MRRQLVKWDDTISFTFYKTLILIITLESDICCSQIFDMKRPCLTWADIHNMLLGKDNSAFGNNINHCVNVL